MVNHHLRWANYYGVSLFVSSWWGAGSFEDITTRDYLLTGSNLGNVQLALFCESLGLLQRLDGNSIPFVEGGANEQQLKSDFAYMATKYFDHPNYLKIDGMPVVFLYVTRVCAGNYQQAFENPREHIRQFSYAVYLVGDEVFWADPNIDRIGKFDAIIAYNMHGPSQYNGYPDDTCFIAGVEQVYKRYQKACKSCQRKVDLIPGIMPAFNDRGVRLEPIIT